MTRHRVAAAVVAFEPKCSLLLPLVKRVCAEADLAFVFVNGAIDTETLQALHITAAEIIESPYNFGIGEALNQVALRAILAGCSRLAVFDDDSSLSSGALQQLNATMNALDAADKRPAVIGPRVIPPQDEPHVYRSPRYFKVGDTVGAASSVLYVITSGSLINLEAFRRIGRFRSDFFMDAIDTEWCFRARARGYSCWVDVGVEMEHRIGGGVTRANVLGRGFPEQPPMRLYAYIRNQTYCLRLPHLPLWWRTLLAAHLARLCGSMWLVAEDKRAMRMLIWHAVRDGIRERLGPPLQAQAAARLA